MNLPTNSVALLGFLVRAFLKVSKNLIFLFA